jgi:hypothetical protein
LLLAPEFALPTLYRLWISLTNEPGLGKHPNKVEAALPCATTKVHECLTDTGQEVIGAAFRNARSLALLGCSLLVLRLRKTQNLLLRCAFRMIYGYCATVRGIDSSLWQC